MVSISSDLEARARTLAQASRVEALLLLRQATGCSLREAIDALQVLAPVARRSALEPHAQLLAFGRFDPALAPFLDYPADFYKGLALGVWVSVWIAEVGGPVEVAALGAIVGIDPGDMNQWHLRPEAIDVAALVEVGHCDEGKVDALRAAGFSFHFYVDPVVAK